MDKLFYLVSLSRYCVIRDSNVAPAKKEELSITLDNSSATALKKNSISRCITIKKNTLFGDKYSIVSKKLADPPQQKSKGGNQGTYLYFKSIFPSMSLNSVTTKLNLL